MLPVICFIIFIAFLGLILLLSLNELANTEKYEKNHNSIKLSIIISLLIILVFFTITLSLGYSFFDDSFILILNLQLISFLCVFGIEFFIFTIIAFINIKNNS